MAKGDHKRAQDMIYGQQRRNESNLDQMNRRFMGNYDRGTGRNFQDYDAIMQGYQNFFRNPMGGGGNMNAPSWRGMEEPYNPGAYNNAQGRTANSRNVGGRAPDINMNQNPAGMWQPHQQGQMDYGNLSDPTTWMGIAGDPSKSAQWIKQNYPDLPDDVAQYYAGVIKGQPGANPTEQAGSSKYYLDMIRDREYGPSGYIGSQAKQGQNWLNQAGAGYSDFANTGGFSDQDYQDLRARAVGPIRSAYSSARREMNRGQRLAGGYAPNKMAAEAKMAREQGYLMGDANTNVNASLAGLRQSGRLAGLGGLSGLGMFEGGQGLARDTAMMNARGNALAGMSGLYGTAPGMSQLYGNQMLQGQGLNNQLAGMLMGNMIDSSQIPGNFQSVMGNIGSVAGLAGGLINPLGSIFGGGPQYGGVPYHRQGN